MSIRLTDDDVLVCFNFKRLCFGGMVMTDYK